MTMIVKDPGTRVDFAFEWGAAYPEGQALVASEWLAMPDEPGGVTIAAQTHELEQAAVTLAGGIAGHVYRVTNRVTLSDGQIDERSMTVRVEER
ncbi:hypothetical protein SAMN06295984_2567 [Sphingopyxis terrae subsp. ummariensis]|uniref:Phage tail protein n=2 Tax=Sphingopyxis terrae TaxID=33052 RepID=A0A1Y6FSE7_9SPHN|nr:hypothetical protein SAMN06295984_2567 [Sphingopyxis terrae subsp. ummariensis]